MSTWYAKNFGDGMLAWEPLNRLEERFFAEHAQAGGPGDMAVFVRHQSDGRLHCEVVAYFSPAAARLAREFDAVPCAKPSPDNLSLLAGSDESWSVMLES